MKKVSDYNSGTPAAADAFQLQAQDAENMLSEIALWDLHFISGGDGPDSAF